MIKIMEKRPVTTTQLTHSELRAKLLWRILTVVLGLSAMFFLPAGTLRYWEAWGFMAVSLIPMSLFAIYLLRVHLPHWFPLLWVVLTRGEP